MKITKVSFWKILPESLKYLKPKDEFGAAWKVWAPEDMVRYDQVFVSEEEPDTVVCLPWLKPREGRWISFGTILKRIPATHREEQIDPSKWWTVIREGEEEYKRLTMLEYAEKFAHKLVETELIGPIPVGAARRSAGRFRTLMDSDFNEEDDRGWLGNRKRRKKSA